jgi:hypothetical protein
MLPLTNYTIEVREVTFAEFHRPGVLRSDWMTQEVPNRDYTSWDFKIDPSFCGFRLYSEMVGEVPGFSLDNGIPLIVSSPPFNYSDFYYCNAIVLSWDEAKIRHPGFSSDPKKRDFDKWSGEFWQRDWRPDMKVFYFKTDDKVYVPFHGYTSAYPEGFVVDECLNSSEI